MQPHPSTHLSIPRERAIAMAGLLRQFVAILEESIVESPVPRKCRRSQKEDDRATMQAMILRDSPGMLPFLPPLHPSTNKPRK